MEFLPPVVQVCKDDYQIPKKGYREPKDTRRLAAGKFDFRDRGTRSVDRGMRLPNVTDQTKPSEHVDDSMDSIKFIRTEATDICDLKDRYKLALKLLKTQREYSDGIALLTSIDEALKEMSNDGHEKLDLHLQVSRQIGDKMQQKAQY